tara:strand:+ start:157 stop:450 length:294 start_codon:yes stop_codon:yes gene_type:complete
MAINQKIPSPQEIKKFPQAFDTKELNQLRELRDKINQLTAEFGQLSINKIKLKELEITLKTRLSTLEKEESKLAKTLSDKYGKGSIDLDSGTFTPIE